MNHSLCDRQNISFLTKLKLHKRFFLKKNVSCFSVISLFLFDFYFHDYLCQFPIFLCYFYGKKYKRYEPHTFFLFYKIGMQLCDLIMRRPETWKMRRPKESFKRRLDYVAVHLKSISATTRRHNTSCDGQSQYIIIRVCTLFLSHCCNVTLMQLYGSNWKNADRLIIRQLRPS